MSRADDLAAKAARLRASAQPPTSVSSNGDTDVSTSVDPELSAPLPESLPLRPAVRTKPVRLTVDVSPLEHSELARHALEAAGALGAARVPGQDIVRALIRRYLNDPELRQTVLTDIDAHRRATKLR